MKKKVITGLIILMGLSIIGIISVQLIWINNALLIQNELFSKSVNEALSKTVTSLEKRHHISLVNKMVFRDSLQWHANEDLEIEFEHDMLIHDEILEPKEPEQQGDPNQQVRIIRKFEKDKPNGEVEVHVNHEPEENPTRGSFSYIIQSRSGKTEPIIIEERTKLEDELIVIRSDTLTTDLDSLYNVSILRIDSTLSNLDPLVEIDSQFFIRAQKKAKSLKETANKAVSEIYSWDIRELDMNLIIEVLQGELMNKDIPIAFDCGVVNDGRWTFSRDAVDTSKIQSSLHRVDLYPNDIIQKNIQVALFFPGQSAFAYKSLNWLLLASLFFSLFILLTFTLSVFYIIRQKKISEMKTDFINNMTHEFKTPIATISVAADSISNEKVLSDRERIRYFTGMIKKENARMNQQVEDILTIARLDKKDFEFKWEAIDAHELILDAIQGITIQVEKKDGRIETKLDALNAVITTDRQHFTNVIYNLLDNAIKYTENQPQIRITSSNKNNGLYIYVEDNGIGMSKSVQNKIFDKFYRQTTGDIHTVKGFGLGLSYVKAILHANGGHISVSSTPGKGSKFELFLPFIRS